MVKAKHPSEKSISKTLTTLNDRWASLAKASTDKGVRLRQAAQQVISLFLQKHTYNFCRKIRIVTNKLKKATLIVAEFILIYYFIIQEMLNDALERALERLNEMERSVASQDVGKDLRSVRDLLKKHQVKYIIYNLKKLKKCEIII